MTSLWVTMFMAGMLTYAIRFSFIQLLAKTEIPSRVRRGLRLVPPAVFSAIITTELLLPNGTLDLSLANSRLLAGLVATLVAWRTKSIVLTILAGMVTLFMIQGLVG